jgi:hypothetical protein
MFFRKKENEFKEPLSRLNAEKAKSRSLSEEPENEQNEFSKEQPALSKFSFLSLKKNSLLILKFNCLLISQTNKLSRR